MTAETGSYVLLLRLLWPKAIAVGKLGHLQFDRPYYAYAGSALGPGGLAARVGRHLKTKKTRHWHIDYLREQTTVVAVWALRDGNRRECRLAGALAELKCAEPVPGFGATDCNCLSHLIGLQDLPQLSTVRAHLAGLGKHVTIEDYNCG